MCWTCQQPGHRAAECPQNKSVSSVEPGKSTEEAEEVREAGGVFWIAGVESTSCKTCAAEEDSNFRTVQSSKRSQSYKDVVLSSTATKVPMLKSTVCNHVPLTKVPILKSTVCNHVPLKNKYEALSEKSESTGKITIDSGAADCVMPKEVLGDRFPLLPAKEGIRFCAANGTPIQNYGRLFSTAEKRGLNCMQFHVTDVKKPLASVSRIVEKGSSVHFTPSESYILSPSGEKIVLKLENGVYVMNVEYCSGFTRPAN